ncbi:glutaredoxin family protein [Tenuibacillus multivorans]|uniref:Glutaredoxin n=1 Tax=Tenuibacillus multivorans TaxID=237069 RepID=A0A1H0DEH9_9BACI|nr:glutaredoxin family protein [Tenuibacillus multivorans]GEL76584.1 hypothetical protein TMU01_08190 [Tenuibacillus multivorans]SDN68573.1 Glutaredoxin [Tenuibacillus multivorans]
MKPKMTFYTKPNCKLCDDAKALLETYQLMYSFDIEEHNIEEDDELLEKYFLTIPVIKYHDQEINAEELNPETLDTFLKENLSD